MKSITLFILIGLSALNQNCNSRSIQQDPANITYEATSRGFFLRVYVIGDSMTISQDRNKPETVKPLNNKELKAIHSELSNLELGSIENLKRPSESSTYDAAPAAILKIDFMNESYSSPSFDHGNPPKEIKPLVDLILSVAKVE